MVEKISIVALTIISFAGFIKRNLSLQKRTGKPVRSKDILVILSSTLLLILINFSVLSENFFGYLVQISILRNRYITVLGYVLLAAAIVLGWILCHPDQVQPRSGIRYD